MVVQMENVKIKKANALANTFMITNVMKETLKGYTKKPIAPHIIRIMKYVKKAVIQKQVDAMKILKKDAVVAI